MYFYKRNGYQCLDLRGDLVLSHNTNLVIARSKSAAPDQVYNGRYAVGISIMTRRQKFRATLAALRFIWGKSTAITPEQISELKGAE